jgi:cell division protease FtsH
MSERLGPVTLAPRENPFLLGADAFGGSRPYSETTATLIDDEVRLFLQQAHDRGVELLRQHHHQLDALADALMEKETLEEDEILRVTGLQRAPQLESHPRPRPPSRNGSSEKGAVAA